MYQIFRLLTVFPQPCFRNDHCLARLRRIELVGVQTAPPGLQDNGVAARVGSLSDPLDFLNVVRKTHQSPALEGRLP